MRFDLASDQTAHLLRAVDAEHCALRDAERRVAKSAAPSFQIFDFLRTDEMGLSRCISALLDPRGTHGQGSAYLELFLDCIDCGPAWRLGLDEAVVDLEMPANGARRYDIEIRLKGERAIVIENKPWAVDQPLQLTHYAMELSQTCSPGGWRLVYLGHGAPTVRSISAELLGRYLADGSLVVMGFRQLAEWLGACALCTEPPVVRMFIEQLEQLVRKSLCGEVGMSEAESIKDVVTQSQENLRAALLVGRSLEAIKQRLLIEGLKAPLEERFGAQLFWDTGALSARSARAAFGVKLSPTAPGYVRFEFYQGDLNALFWGVHRVEKLVDVQVDHPDAGRLRDSLRMRFGPSKGNEHWFWYCENVSHLGKPGGKPMPKNWDFDEEPWLGMQRRDLHVGFVNAVDAVVRAAAEASALTILQTP